MHVYNNLKNTKKKEFFPTLLYRRIAINKNFVVIGSFTHLYKSFSSLFIYIPNNLKNYFSLLFSFCFM